MKFLTVVLLFCGVSAIAGPRNVGNGGGGVVRDGVYMTFGSAGIYVDPEPVAMAAIPGLDLTVQTFRALKIDKVNHLLSLVLPFGARKYFNVVKEKFDEATYRSLREEYAKLAKVPADTITIFAVTDPQTRQTFLLPEFFGLRPSEQAAILFHEAYWIEKPSASYQEVVRAEIAFQKFIEAREKGIYEPTFAERLADLFEDRGLALNMHLQQDLESGALAELGATAQSGVPITSFLDPRLHCDNHEDYHQGYARGAVVPSSGQLQFSYDLMLRFPNSHFLRAVVEALSPDRQGRGAFMLFGLSKAQVDSLEAKTSRGACFPHLAPMNLRFVKVAMGDGRLRLEQQWEKLSSQRNFESSVRNGDGSFTIQKPFFLFRGEKIPLVGELKRGGESRPNDFRGVCRYLGFSEYVAASRRVLAIYRETDAVTFQNDGSVQAVGRYTHAYNGLAENIDFMLTEITCK
jgi:hypothetical protein